MNNGKTREEIMVALETLLQGVTSLKTVTRRLKLWGDVPTSEKPWLGIQENTEGVVPNGESTPSATTFDVNLLLYIDTGKDPKSVPIIVMNGLLDDIDAALAGEPIFGKQTLGGLVSHCWVEGKIEKDPGDLDGDGLAIIPLKILIP